MLPRTSVLGYYLASLRDWSSGHLHSSSQSKIEGVTASAYDWVPRSSFAWAGTFWLDCRRAESKFTICTLSKNWLGWAPVRRVWQGDTVCSLRAEARLSCSARYPGLTPLRLRSGQALGCILAPLRGWSVAVAWSCAIARVIATWQRNPEVEFLGAPFKLRLPEILV